MEFWVHSFHAKHLDLMLFFEDVWVVATTQATKDGRFDKTPLMQYNPGSGWCRFGVVHVHAHAPPRTTTFPACASLEYHTVPGSPLVSRYTQEESIKSIAALLKVKYH